MWLIFSASTISWQLTWWSCSTNCKITLTCPVTGQPERGTSLKSKFPERNRTNHSWVLHSLTAFSPYTSQNFRNVFTAILTFFIVKMHYIAYFFRYFNHYKINITFYTRNYFHKICILKCFLVFHFKFQGTVIHALFINFSKNHTWMKNIIIICFAMECTKIRTQHAVFV